MSNTEDLQSIEISIEDAKRAIARKDALIRLEGNHDFQELIQKGFLEQHAIRQVMLKAAPGQQSDEQQNIFDAQIVAIGNFKQYLIAVFTTGMQAEQALAADEATMEEILSEDIK